MALLETLSFACLYLYCTHQVATTLKSPRVPSRHFKLTGAKPHDLWRRLQLENLTLVSSDDDDDDLTPMKMQSEITK